MLIDVPKGRTWVFCLTTVLLSSAVVTGCSGWSAEARKLADQCGQWEARCAGAVVVALERALAEEWMPLGNTAPAGREVCELAGVCWENHIGSWPGADSGDDRHRRIKLNRKRGLLLGAMEQEAAGVLAETCEDLGRAVKGYQEVRIRLTKDELHSDAGEAIRHLLQRSRELYRRWDCVPDL